MRSSVSPAFCELARVHVDADAAAVDLAGPQVDQLDASSSAGRALRATCSARAAPPSPRATSAGVGHPGLDGGHVLHGLPPRVVTSAVPRRVNCDDRPARRDVTEDEKLAGRALRGAPPAPAGGRLPDARLAERGRRRGAGGVAAAQPQPTATAIDNLGGWLTTVVARVCLNMLRSRKARREDPLETHLPDPVVSLDDRTDPEHEALLADSVGLALLVVLETLPPPSGSRSCCTTCSRCRSSEIADDRRPLARRGPPARQPGPPPGARQRRRCPTPTSPSSAACVDAFFAAAREGDFDALVAVLDPDVVLRADGGATARGRSSAAPARSPRRAMRFARLSPLRPPRAGQRRRRRRRRSPRTAARSRSWPSPSADGTDRRDRRHRRPASGSAPRPAPCSTDGRSR